jgi:hypothetical protein
MEFITEIWRFEERRLLFVTLTQGKLFLVQKVGRLMASITRQTTI